MQPDTDTLRRFVQGQLSADESAPVELWLQEHPEAIDVLQTLVGSDDTLVIALRENPQQTGPDSPSIAELISWLASLRGGMETLAPEASPVPAPPPAAPVLPGMETEVGFQKLGGFRMGKLLGAGGMGQMYEAFDERLERRVAVKIINPHIAADPKAKARFLREAKTAAAVEHDHIIPTPTASAPTSAASRGRPSSSQPIRRQRSKPDGLLGKDIDPEGMRQLFRDRL